MEGNLTRGSNIDKENITFRLNNSLLKKLKNNAVDEKIAVNALVTKILDDYFEWGQNAVKAGWMVIPKITLKELIDNTSEKDLVSIGEGTADLVLEIMMMMSGQYDLRTFLSITQTVARKSGFDVNIIQDDGVKIIIQHYMGKKWSLFRTVFFDRTLNAMGYHHEIKSTPNSVILTIK